MLLAAAVGAYAHEGRGHSHFRPVDRSLFTGDDCLLKRSEFLRLVLKELAPSGT